MELMKEVAMEKMEEMRKMVREGGGGGDDEGC